MGRPTRTSPKPIEAVAALPFQYAPRPYQEPFWRAMLGWVRYAALVWHRRAGKDTSVFNWLLVASQMRVGTYYYLFTTFAQARRVLWEGRNRDGMRFLDHIPPAMIASKNETDMRIVFSNGSALQLVGTDHFDAIRGTNPVGVVFSEYAAQNPAAWQVVRPILRENGGWAVFVYTPLGRNHGYDLFEMARSNPDWFAERLTVTETGVFSPEDLDAERAAGADEEFIQQEYYCSFVGSVQGSYYARELALAFAEGRVTRVPYDPQHPVETAWDLGTKDANAIWFYQQVGRKVHLIDYHEQSGSNLVELAAVIRGKRYAYLPGVPHLAPHDIAKTEYSSGRTIRELARDLGLEFRVVPKQNPLERVTAARVLFPRIYADSVLCASGLAALAQYHKEWDPETKSFALKPAHDWASHGADAFGHLAVGIEAPHVAPVQTQAEVAFNPLDYDTPRWGTGREPRVERDFAPFAA